MDPPATRKDCPGAALPQELLGELMRSGDRVLLMRDNEPVTTPTVGAVFTRNHRQWLKEAEETLDRNPDAIVAFRSARTWRQPERWLTTVDSVPVYIAVVDGGATVEYEAELVDLVIAPRWGDKRTEELFKHVPPGTRHEGLSAPGRYGSNRDANTLYALKYLRRRTPFPITNLRKLDSGQPISPDFQYSYALVRRRNLK